MNMTIFDNWMQKDREERETARKEMKRRVGATGSGATGGCRHRLAECCCRAGSRPTREGTLPGEVQSKGMYVARGSATEGPAIGEICAENEKDVAGAAPGEDATSEEKGESWEEGVVVLEKRCRREWTATDD